MTSNDQTVISFCGGCGCQLPAMGNLPEPEQICLNCNANVAPSHMRLEGWFNPKDANRLLALFEGGPA